MPGLAIYAGSFDPPTTGHLWMIERGAALFDRLIVAIGTNPDKRYAYGLDERLAWLREATRHVPNIEVAHYDNMFLARYAAERSAGFILRGIRSEADFAYEQAMRHINADLSPSLTTVFLMPPREIAEVSSSLVKGMIGPAGWPDVLRSYVPACVFDALLKKHAPASR